MNPTPVRDHVEHARALSPLLILIGIVNVFVLAAVLSGVGLYIPSEKPMQVVQLACGVALCMVGLRDRLALINRGED